MTSFRRPFQLIPPAVRLGNCNRGWLAIGVCVVVFLASMARAMESPAETPLATEARLRVALAERGDALPDPASDHLEVELAEVLINYLARPGDAAEVEQRLQAVLARTEAVSPPDLAFTGRVQHVLAQAAMALGEPDQAATRYDAAVATLTAAHGDDARQTLTARMARAVLYSRTGRPAEADAESADIATRFRANDPDSLAALDAYGQRAVFLIRLGRFDDAEAQIRDLLARHAKTSVLPFSQYQTQLNNLAYLLNRAGRHEECAGIMGELVTARTVALGPTAESTLVARYNLAYVYVDLGRYEEAELIFRTDLAFAESRDTPGKFTPADYLGRLGEMNFKRGNFEAAVRDLNQGVDLLDAPLALKTLHQEDAARERMRASLVLAQRATGDGADMRTNLSRWLDQTEERFRARLNFTSEADRLAFFSRERPLDLASRVGDPDLLARAVLRFKGVVLDSILEDQRLALASSDPEIQQLLKDYQTVLADDEVQVTDPLLGSRRDQLERELARRALTAAGHRRALLTDAEAVRAALPPGAALVEYVRYRDLTSGVSASNATESYLALIGAAETGWRIVSLGAASELDAALARYRILVRRGGPITWAQEVRRRVLDPVRAILPPGINELIIAPDGPLNQLAFASLPEDDGGFVLQSMACSFVTSGRDILLRENRSAVAPGPDVTDRVLAAPVVTVRADLAELPGAEAEGRAVAALLPGAVLHLGAEATPAMLAAAPQPQRLHLACHAVLPTEANLDPAAHLRGTGLVLAGEDGFLSAAAIAALDLRATELVFLSACDSGGGENVSGEGVFGLRRGFSRAGAHTLVMTLWPVDDQAGRQIIDRFYQGLVAGEAPREALVNAQRAALVRAQAAGQDPVEALREFGAYTVSWHR